MSRSWILNCKSSIFDFESALSDERILEEGMTWKVSQEFKSIQEGDIYFLYAGVPHQSIVACGFIEEGVREQECDSISAKYWKKKKNGNIAPRIFITIGHRFDPYIKASDINPEGTGVNDLVPLGKQGSNKQIPPLAFIRLKKLLNIELE